MSPFERLFVPDEVQAAVSDRGWLEAMLEAERALARVEALAGVIPAEAAAVIAAACEPDGYDAYDLARKGRLVGNPVEPLVRALRDRVGGDAAAFVHLGATSQDILDCAAMLVVKAARELILEELEGAAAACARLAEENRSTPIAGRTLLQQAVPTTFGLKAAGWLVALVDARGRLARVQLPAQLGGAAGTLAVLGEAGPDVLRLFAAELKLEEPLLPWHVHRAPIAEVGSALDAAASVCAKVGLDVVLLAQTEVGEVAESEGGGSSTMPHKRNPVRAVLARSCARIVHANAGLLTGGDFEHERAAGAWQAEWPALAAVLEYVGGAAAAARGCLELLEVRPERMAANMGASLLSERDAFVERGLIERDEAYLGSAEKFVDRALARYRAALEESA